MYIISGIQYYIVLQFHFVLIAWFVVQCSWSVHFDCMEEECCVAASASAYILFCLNATFLMLNYNASVNELSNRLVSDI